MKTKLLLLVNILLITALNAQWVPSTFPVNFTTFDQVDFVSKDTVWGAEQNGIVVSFDGGKSFIRQNDMAITAISHIFNAGGELYMVSNSIRKSADFGVTWTTIPIKTVVGDTIYRASIYQAHIFKNGHGYALGATNNKYRLFNTDNYGLNWVEADSSKVLIPDFSNGISSIFKTKQYCFDSSCITWNTREKNKFWIFDSYGSEVKELDFTASISADIRSYAFSDLDNGLIITTDRNCYLFSAGSSNLILKGEAPATVAMDFARSFLSTRSFYILGNPSAPGSFISRDSGSTWNPIEENYRHMFIKMYSDSIGISSVNSTSEAKVRSFEALFSSISKLNQVNLTFRLYPNPTNHEINLSGVLAQDINEVSLYNLQGKLIQRFEPNLKLSVAGIPSGIYLLKISTQNSIGFVKLVKE
jgi:hypothetical protein